MFEELLAFFLGVVSVLSPCVLPVLPIVFAGSGLRIKDSIALFSGLILSISLLSLTPILIAGFRPLAFALLIFFSIYLISDRLELEFSRRISKLGRLARLRLPSFLVGFFLGFLWLPCIVPFLGIAVSEAILSERPLLVSICYVLGLATAVIVILLFGKNLKISFERSRKVLGAAVLISTLYLMSLYK